MADAKFTYLARVPEATYGTTPATPPFVKSRFTKADLSQSPTLVDTTEIRADGMIGDSVKVFADVKGGFDFEFSATDLDDILAAAFRSTWAAGVLYNGVVLSSFTFEKKLLSNVFMTYVGCVVDSFMLKISPKKIISGQVKLMGKISSESANAATGATYTSPSTNSAMSSTGSVSNTSINGTAYAVKDWEFTINNSTRQLDKITSDYSVDSVAIGNCGVTGKIQVYFKDATIIPIFLNSTGTTLALTLTDGTHTYAFQFPNVKFKAGGDPQIEGNNTDLMQQLEFVALAGTVNSTPCNIMVTRTP